MTRGYEDNRNLLIQVKNMAGTNLISQFDYQNDAVGRRVKRIDTSAGVTTNEFGYNPRSELIGALMGANAFAWVFDNIGNRITASTNATTFTYTANSLNQYTQIADGGLRALSYDLDENLTNDGQWAYTWDGENRLIGASNESMVASYAYDYMSRRFRKVVNGATTNLFVYDGWNLICEERSTLDASPSTNFYVWGQDLSGSLLGAGGIGGLLCVIRNGTPYFPCYDANGNISDYVDTNGTVVAHREYDAYGNTIVATGPLVNDFNFWFSTKYLDQETGLYYYGYRYYDPVTGRWLSRDPIGEMGGLNLYVIAANSPINGYDPLGLSNNNTWCVVSAKLPGELVPDSVSNGSGDEFYLANVSVEIIIIQPGPGPTRGPITPPGGINIGQRWLPMQPDVPSGTSCRAKNKCKGTCINKCCLTWDPGPWQEDWLYGRVVSTADPSRQSGWRDATCDIDHDEYAKGLTRCKNSNPCN